MNLSESTFLVTGGASGLGEATARRLHAAGARIVISDMDDAKGAALVREFEARIHFVRTDISDEADADRAMAEVQGVFGQLHGLVNCAGISLPTPVLVEGGSAKLEAFLRCVQVNLAGTFNMIRAAVPLLTANQPRKDGERGCIINTASIVAFDGHGAQTGYAAAYAGVIAMTLPLARELGPSGVRVMTIAPGPFRTPRLQSLSPDALDALGKTAPFPPRLGESDEFAALAQHIFENVMLNGETIRLDGAMRLEVIKQ